MSLYDKASLIQIPSGYKEDKLYSIKPTDGSGDLTFTRASTATRVNDSGLIETVAIDTPRIDYTGGGCGKLLLEGQRSNSITYSEDFADAYWTKTNASIVANVGVAPDGTTNADRLVPDTSLATTHLVYKTSQSINGNCYSIFAKADGFNWLLLTSHLSSAPTARGTFFDLENGVIGEKGNDQTAWMEDYGNGWWKCSIDAGTSPSSIYSAFCCEADDDITIAAPNGTDGIQIWGAEKQDGVYPTSYIPTSGSTVTRVADTSSTTGLSSVIGQTEGTVFVDVDFETLSGSNMFLSIRPDSGNKIEIYRASSVIYAEIASSNSFNISKTNNTIGRYKIAFAYSSGSSAMYINGVLIGSNTTTFAFTSTLDNIDVNSRGTSFIEQSNYNGVMVFPTALSDAELIDLTTL